MLPSIVFHLSLGLYVLAALAGGWAVRSPAPLRVRLQRALLVGAAAALGGLLALEGSRGGAFPAASLFDSLLWLALLLAAAGLGADLAFRAPAFGLGAAAGGAAALLAALAVVPASGPSQDLLRNGWVGFHIACMMLAYTAFALAGLAGALFLFEESCLKRKRNLALIGGLPSLATLDALEARSVLTGFLLFTVGLIVGYLVQRAETAAATWWRTDPKVVWTAVTWAAYAGVAAARLTPALRGRKVAALAVLGFAFVLFTYFGANYLSSGFHAF
jgi:ABC-type transport system involved in cytochrome c biogenesis permease subunit